MLASACLFSNQAYLAEGGVTAQNMEPFDKVKAIFHEYCAMCHGYDGVPMLPNVPNFLKGERLERSDEELLEVISKGKDVMPPWDGVLDAEKQQQLLYYVRGIAGDRVFASKCNRCHGIRLPALNSDLPQSRKELLDVTKKLEVCSGHDIEGTMTNQELADVVVYLRSLKKM